MLFAPIRWALRITALVLAAIVLYFAVTLVQVWLTSRQYDPHTAGAILVMGAAQYDGVPSPDLASRLNEALLLYHQGYAHLIMVTGNKKPGDVYTEAQSGEMYLVSKGVPRADILEAGGDDSYENVAEAAPELKGRKATVILVTTDPFHEDRSMAIAQRPGTGAVAHADPDVADQGVVHRALLLEGGGRRRPGADHRIQPPGVAARRLAGVHLMVGVEAAVVEVEVEVEVEVTGCGRGGGDRRRGGAGRRGGRHHGR